MEDEKIEDCVIPIKFYKKLNVQEIESLVDVLNDFAKRINTTVDFISFRAVAKRMSSLSNIKNEDKEKS